MVPTTIRLPEELHAKVVAAASERGVSLNVFIAAILEAALRSGWTVERRPAAEVVKPA